jgi:hypothetical protein
MIFFIKLLLYIVIIILIIFFIYKGNNEQNLDILPSETKKTSIYVSKKEDLVYNIILDLFPNYTWNRSYRKLSFLTNPYTKKNLEIDICCLDHNIAIEVQGEQHYFYVKHFDKNNEGKAMFYKQIMRDYIKKQLLKEHKWKYIEIPYTMKDKHEISNYILYEINK